MRVRLSKAVVFDLASKPCREDGVRFWIGGESGSGKSSCAMLIVSQLVAQGGQVIVLDAHGEYGRLWETSPGRVTAIGYEDDDPIDLTSVEWCLDIVRSGKSLLLNLSHWTDLDPVALDAFALEFMRGLYLERRKNPRQTMVLIEESQNFIPQQQMANQAENIRVLLAIMTGGRKYGLNFILSSQQQSLVDVRALSSCNVRVFLRTSEQSDWNKRIKRYVPESMGITFNGRRGIRTFESGQAIVLSRWTPDAKVQLLLPDVLPRKPLDDAAEEALQ